MTITDRDVAIYTQVAFKEAAAKSGDVLDSTEASLFEARFAYMADVLVTKIGELQAQYATVVPTPAPAAVYNAEAGLASELGATAATVEIVVAQGVGQQGPLPAWFIKDAAEKGVTKAFDNRHRLVENPKTPWFKSADDRKLPFWPPRGTQG